MPHVEYDFFFALRNIPPKHHGREAADVPGVHLGPRRQQHPADLHMPAERRPMQRGGSQEAVPRGHGARLRLHEVPHGTHGAALDRLEEAVAASGHGPRTGGRSANEIPSPIKCKPYEIILGKMTCCEIDVFRKGSW